MGALISAKNRNCKHRSKNPDKKCVDLASQPFCGFTPKFHVISIEFTVEFTVVFFVKSTKCFWCGIDTLLFLWHFSTCWWPQDLGLKSIFFGRLLTVNLSS